MEIPLVLPSQLTLALATTQVEAKSTPSVFKSPLRYPGGKQKAIEKIAAVMPPSASEFREPLVGGGSVYFHARTKNFAQTYWINDAFKELISFWSIVQNEKTCARLVKDLEELRARFKTAEESKAFFLEAREEKTRSKYREALLFFFFNRVTFSGTTKAGGFSAAASQTRFTQSSIDRLLPMPDALKDIKITCSDFGEVVEAPGNDVFLFLDPPYWTATKLYGRDGDLHAFDHWKLAKLLKKTKHRFLITYDDCEEIRELYKWANIGEWTLQYGMNNCSADRKSRIGSELLIRNY